MIPSKELAYPPCVTACLSRWFSELPVWWEMFVSWRILEDTSISLPFFTSILESCKLERDSQEYFSNLDCVFFFLSWNFWNPRPGCSLHTFLNVSRLLRYGATHPRPHPFPPRYPPSTSPVRRWNHKTRSKAKSFRNIFGGIVFLRVSC